MATSTTRTNKPINPRGNDQSPKGYNRAALYSGKALDFDGVNDYVDVITDDTDLQEFSVVQYVNLGATATSRIFYANFNPTIGNGFATGISDFTANVPKFYTKGASDNTLVGSFTLNAGEWYQIVATYDGATKKLYVNGVLDTEVAFSDTIVYTNATNRIGALSGGTAQALDGQLSNVKVYSTALTPAQVADLYNNPEKIVPTGVEDTALKLWLPMMEGAGTTAYDGSGNGNHGTISGATYVHGVGAPVAQSAVIDWNKGVNVISDSEDLTQWDTLVLGTGSVSVTANYAEAPNGTQTADRVQASAGIGYGLKSRSATSSVTGDYVVGIWAKSNTGSSQNVAIYGRNNVSNVVVVTTEWTQIVKPSSGTSNFINVGATLSSDANVDVLLWGGQMEQNTTTLGPYIPTLSTAQTTPVLLPQGLTSGRDITGVNLFENVRKQGALNLDGNSWAEVHDNASVDLTDGISLECWYYNDGSTDKGLLGKYYSGKLSYLLWVSTTQNAVRIFTNNLSSEKTGLSLGWHHVVGTYDGANRKIYVDGVLGDTGVYTTDMATSDEAIEIGRYFGTSTTAFANQIAQPRIYNRALTAEEVERNYNAGKNIYK